MDPEEESIKEIFAYFGRLMYQIQCIEKGLSSIILLNYQQHSTITQSRYDELLYEKSIMTFGQLKRELFEQKLFSEDELHLLNNFHQKRDYLTHNYWWDHSVEISKSSLHGNLINELSDYTSYFNFLQDLIERKFSKFEHLKNLDLESIQQELLKGNSTPLTEQFRTPKKNETIINIYKHSPIEKSEIPVFEFEDKTLWTVCEIGLSQIKTLNNNCLTPIQELQNILPINQFNPRPQILRHWDYILDLKNKGYYIKISPIEDKEQVSFRWGIHKNKPQEKSYQR